MQLLLCLLLLLTSQERIEELPDLFTLWRQLFHLAEPPLEAGVLSPFVLPVSKFTLAPNPGT